MADAAGGGTRCKLVEVIGQVNPPSSTKRGCSFVPRNEGISLKVAKAQVEGFWGRPFRVRVWAGQSYALQVLLQ
jgi:hypothetical protein